MTVEVAAPQHVPGRPAVRVGIVSAVLRPRTLAVVVLACIALVLLAAINIGRGDYPISVPEVIRVLVGGGDEAQRFIVMDLRLPRTLTGILVGVAFGLSGAITQVIARNALASPDILGISQGAAVGAVAVIVLGGGTGGVGAALGGVSVPVAALIGGLLTAFVIYLLAWRRGLDGYRLVLVGIAIAAMLASLTTWLMIKAEIQEAQQAAVWLTGSLNGRGWEHVQPLALALAIIVPITLILAFVLGALQYGDDTVRSLGVRVETARLLCLVAAVALASAAVAAAGPIAFVAFVVPQIALRLCGTARPPLVASALLGACLVVGADVIARTLLGDIELPVGLVTAAVGAPYLLWLLIRGNRKVTA